VKFAAILAVSALSCGGTSLAADGGETRSVSGDSAASEIIEASDGSALGSDVLCPYCSDAAAEGRAEAMSEASPDARTSDQDVAQLSDADIGDAIDASPLERCLSYCESLPDANANSCAVVCAGPPKP
jgi:hypothetical protein